MLSVYRNADADPGANRLMGLECAMDRAAALPESCDQSHFRSFDKARASYVILAAGTRLRVVHFETSIRYAILMAERGPETVQALVENGPYADRRVVIGELGSGGIWCENEHEGLSAKDGDAIRAVRAEDAQFFLHSKAAQTPAEVTR